MSEISPIVLINAVDPSRTTSLRDAFARAMRMRFRTFLNTLSEVIVDDNVFGIVGNRKPGPGAFAFPQSADKIAAFMNWVHFQIVDDIHQTSQLESVGRSVGSAWTNRYIQDAYKRGITKARNQMKGFAPALSITGGIDAAMMTLAHIDRRSSLFIRTFNELVGVTDVMSQQIGRVIAQAVADKLSPSKIRWEVSLIIAESHPRSAIVANTQGKKPTPAERRAELIARTETIRAFAEAQLTEFESWGVHGVSAKAEFVTAGDHRVCPRCSSLERNIFTIEEARGMIPVHPLCRCVWVPNIQN